MKPRIGSPIVSTPQGHCCDMGSGDHGQMPPTDAQAISQGKRLAMPGSSQDTSLEGLAGRGRTRAPQYNRGRRG